MAEIERLSGALPAPMADAVRRAVAAGDYASTSEVIHESRRQLRECDVEIVRQRWDEGKASGRAGPLDIRRIITEERSGQKGDRRRRG